MGSRVLLRRDSTVLRRSYLKDGVHTRARAMFDDTAGGPSMLMRGQYDPSLEINYVDDPRLAVGEVFTRATIRTVRDFEGRTLVLNSGEVGFWGMRRVENLFATTSEDFSNAAWTKTGVTILGTGNATWAAGGGKKLSQAVTLVTGRRYVVAFKVRSKFGADQPFRLVGDQGATFSADFVAGYNDGEFELQFTATGTAGVLGVASDSTNAAANLQVTWGQLEDTTGRSNLAHSEYVSRGVLVAPYHGANVDGVRYMVTQPNGTLIPRYVGATIKYYQQLGVVGGNATTPSSAAANITGDVDIRVSLAPATWNPATSIAPVNKHNGAGGYELNIIGSGVLRLWFGDGVQHSATSTAGVPFVAETMGWVRVTRSAGTGNVTFYYRYLDTDAWTQLGAVVATTASNLALNATAVTVGSSSGGVYANFVLYRAQIYAGATLAVDFNPADAAAAGAASLVSSTTGETWTINGNGTTSRVNTWTKPARCGLLRERASSNLLLFSEDLTATWVTTNATISANARTGISGALTADKIACTNAVGVTHNVLQGVAKAASSLPYAVAQHAIAGELRFLAFRLDDGGGNGVYCCFDLLLGTVTTVATATGAGFTAGTASLEQVLPGFWRCTCTFTSNAATSVRMVTVVQDANGNPFTYTFTANTGDGIYCDAATVEQLDHATSYIPTAAATVTRNKDSLAGPNPVGSAWCNSSSGTWYAEFIALASDATNARIVGVGNARTPLSLGNSFSPFACTSYDLISAVNTANFGTFNTLTKMASRYGASGKAIVVNNGAVASDANNGFPGNITAFDIGVGSSGGTTELDAFIGRIWHIPRDVGDAIMKPLTA